MALKKGICKNYDNCSLADSGEIQETDPTEFKCSECGKDLHEIKDGPGPGTKLPLIIGGAAAVLIGLGGGGYFLFSGNKPDDDRAAFVADSLRQAAEQKRIADSLRFVAEQEAAEEARLQAEQEEAEALRLAEEQQRIADSIRVADSIRIADSIAAATKTKPSQGQSTQTNSSNWNGVATYNGPMQGGQPNGFGGTLTFKSNYQLDLKDGNGTKLDIKAGETIVNTKFENGKLRQGELRRKDGTRKWFNI